MSELPQSDRHSSLQHHQIGVAPHRLERKRAIRILDDTAFAQVAHLAVADVAGTQVERHGMAPAGEIDQQAAAARERQRAVVVVRSAGEDRKSTRLNSSHTVISYAVFCLKKKKKPKLDCTRN